MLVAQAIGMRTLLVLTAVAALPVATLADAPRADRAPAGGDPPVLQVTSRAFGANQEIPPKYTCEGTQTTPPLAWSRVPAGTQSVAILVEDPDASSGMFTHWLVTGIAPTTTSLAAGAALPSGAAAARNGRGRLGYDGPCPPHGRHRYVFRVFALDTAIPPPKDREAFLSAIRGHVLAEGRLVGTYQKTTPS
jgi:Raf kinase inhibitor-like YbhB/YbcL family protein